MKGYLGKEYEKLTINAKSVHAINAFHGKSSQFDEENTLVVCTRVIYMSKPGLVNARI